MPATFGGEAPPSGPAALGSPHRRDPVTTVPLGRPEAPALEALEFLAQIDGSGVVVALESQTVTASPEPSDTFTPD